MSADARSGVSRPSKIDPERSASRREVEGSLTIPARAHDGLFYVYILTNSSDSVLYTGYTCSLRDRIQQHREQSIEGFTRKYQVGKLISYEEYADQERAEARERQIKGWRRDKKIVLIEKMNPRWVDLFDEISGKAQPQTLAEAQEEMVRVPSTPHAAAHSAQDL